MDRPQQRWTRQLLRGSALLPRPSTLKLASLPLASGASLRLAFYAWPPPPSSSALEPPLLLSEQNVTFDKALTTAQGLEAAAKNLREFHHDTKPSRGNGNVHKVARDGGPRKEKREGQTVQGRANTVCYRCGKPGHSPISANTMVPSVTSVTVVSQHLQPVCRSRPQKAIQGTGRTTYPVVSHLQESQEYLLFLLGDDTKAPKPLEVTMQVDRHQLVMKWILELASLSLISHETYQWLWPSRPLKASSVNLHTYSGDRVGVLGGLDVDVSYGDQNPELPLLVVEGSGPSLFGKDWLARLKLDWKVIYMVNCHPVEALLTHHKMDLAIFGVMKLNCMWTLRLCRSFARLD